MQSNYFKLMEVAEQQSAVIKRQTSLISQLMQDNAEKENLISVLMSGSKTKNKQQKDGRGGRPFLIERRG